SPDIAKEIAQGLLALPAESHAAKVNGSSGWTAPVSLLAVDHLYETLDLHPLVKPFWQQVRRWLNAHKDGAFVALILLAVMAGYHFWLQMSFKRSQERLHKTLTDLADKQSQLEHAQRIAIVDELGSSIAHELNQPLSAIRNFAQSVELRLQKNISHEKITPILKQIVAQLDRTDAIIGRLRQLIKHPKGESRLCQPDELLQASFSLMDHRLKEQGIRLLTQL
ncbi:histidine kinase dimerization/phospho-acceptor domain-containing protein, partial [Oceanospirillum sp. HFRX-1_2]